MSRRMFVPFHDDGIISQFEGYEELEELDWDAYRERYGNIQRLDRILRAEGDDPNRYKVSKQADVVMLFYLFSPATLCGAVRAARLRVSRRHGRPQHRLLRPAHLARLDAQLRHLRRSARPARPRELLGALPGGAAQRRRGHPGRHDPGGHSHGRDGGDGRPHAARLPRHRDPRRRPSLPSRRLPAAVERGGVPDAVSAHAAARDARPRPARRSRSTARARAARSGSGVGDEIRELCPGDTESFELSSPVAGRRVRGTERDERAGAWRRFRERSSTSTVCSSTRRTRRRGASRCAS